MTLNSQSTGNIMVRQVNYETKHEHFDLFNKMFLEQGKIRFLFSMPKSTK